MNIESLRAYCLAKPAAMESLPFGPDVLVFKVGGKIFLLCQLYAEDLSFSIKCDPELAIELRERYDCVQPGYHLNKKHWNTVTANGSVSGKMLQEWIDHSYELVMNSLPVKTREKIRGN